MASRLSWLLRKTLKREMAMAMVLGLFALAAYAMAPSDPDLVRARGTVVGALALPVIIYAALAFGMQWVSTQTGWGSGSYGSSFDNFGSPQETYSGPAMPPPPGPTK